MARVVHIAVSLFTAFTEPLALAQTSDAPGQALQPGAFSSISQTGSANQAYIEQQSALAPGNSAGIVQNGAGNIGAISQTGQNNNASLEQHGTGLNDQITQNGAGLSVKVQEFGQGTGAPVIVNQYSASPGGR